MKLDNINELSALFINEPSSLEVLLLLSDEGPMTLEQISKEIIDTKIIDLLNNLKKLNMVYIKDDLVILTCNGQNLITKLRKKIEENRS